MEWSTQFINEGVEESSKQAETERSLHEAGAAERRAVGGRRLKADSADRSHQETVGLHQEERPAGQEEQAHDQRRRQAQGRLRGQRSSLDVRDDQAREQAPQINGFKGSTKRPGHPGLFIFGGTR